MIDPKDFAGCTGLAGFLKFCFIITNISIHVKKKHTEVNNLIQLQCHKIYYDLEELREKNLKISQN